MTKTAAGPDIHTYVPEETVDPALTAFLREAAAQTPSSSAPTASGSDSLRPCTTSCARSRRHSPTAWASPSHR